MYPGAFTSGPRSCVIQDTIWMPEATLRVMIDGKKITVVEYCQRGDTKIGKIADVVVAVLLPHT